MIRFISLLLVLLLFVNIAFAADDDSYVKTTDFLLHRGASKTVISHEDIRKLQIPYVADLLRVVAGITSRSTNDFSLRGLGIRGLSPLILFDGVEIELQDLEAIGTTNIERIEILRGPQAALYGGGSLAGVINIVTRESGELLGARLEGGTDAFRRGSFRAAAGSDRNNAAFEYDRVEQDITDDRKLKLRTIAFNIRGQILETTNVGFIYRDSNTNLEGASFSFFQLPVQHRIMRNWYAGLKLSHVKSERQFFSGERRHSNNSLEINSAYRINENHSIFAGFESENFELKNSNPQQATTVTRDTSSVYAQYSGALHKTLWSVTLRNESADGEQQFSYRAGAEYRINNELSAFGSVGSGFLQPVFDFNVQDPFVIESNGFDIGLRYALLTAPIRLSAGYFRQTRNALNEDDLVDAEDVTYSGFEMEGTVEVIPTQTIYGSYSYIDVGDQFLSRCCIPQHSISIGTSSRFARKFLVNTRFWRTTALPIVDEDARFTFDILGSYDLRDYLQPYIRIRRPLRSQSASDEIAVSGGLKLSY